MQEAYGDIWEYAKDNAVDALCVFTNMAVSHSRLIMGGGQAREARTLFPILPNLWGERYAARQADGDKRSLLIWDPLVNTAAIVSFPTKYHPSDDADLNLIVQTAHELVEAATVNSWEKVVLGRPGCGLGSLTWTDVKPALEPLLDDRFTVITNI